MNDREGLPIFRRIKTILLCGILVLLAAVVTTATAEYGRVRTPGGPVKMRKTESSKGKLVCEIPNNAIIEADETGEEWCHVIYNGKSGYVMTRFLKLASVDDGSGLKIHMEPEDVHAGDVIRFTAEYDEDCEYRFTVTEGKKEIRGKKNSHGEVYYRPRKEGFHCLEVTVYDRDGNEKTGEIYFDVGKAEQDGTPDNRDFTLYSQKDGWWTDKRYSSSNLSDSGCAIFTLAHALQRLNYEGDRIRPEKLAVKYAFCLVDGGTLNETLIGRTARDFGYTTQKELIENRKTITDKLQNGAVFTFAIVKGHIALAAGIDGDKIMIIDSAPSCTLERIKNGKMYTENETGDFTEITDLAQVPGARYFFETDQYGGLIYYLDLDYVAKRGVRLIQPVGKGK